MRPGVVLSVVAPLYNEGERARALWAHLRAQPGLAEAVLVDASDDAASMAVVNSVIPEDRKTGSECDHVFHLSGISRTERDGVDSDGTAPAKKNAGVTGEETAGVAGDGNAGVTPLPSPPQCFKRGRGRDDAAPAKKNAGVTGNPTIHLLRVATPSRARQMNAGAAACAGDVLLFLHADSRLPRRAAERIAAAIARGRRWGWFDLKLDARGIIYRVIERMISLRARFSGIATGDMALFVERDLFAFEGGFADLPLFEDVEFSRRLKRAGRPAVIKDRVTTSARRWQQNGVGRTVFLMWKLRFLYWRGRDPARLAAAYNNVRDAA